MLSKSLQRTSSIRKLLQRRKIPSVNQIVQFLTSDIKMTESKAFFDINQAAVNDPEGYYDSMAVSYESTISDWGYEMPLLSVQALVRELNLSENSAPTVLDLACGSGLIGEEIRRQIPKSNLIGADISAQMLEVAKQKVEIYDKLVKADLSKELDFGEEKFDAVICIGAATYFAAEDVLDNWLNVCKDGGLFVVTHKMIKWDEWEKVQGRFEENGKIKLRYRSSDLPYLPGGPDPAGMVRIYVYEKVEG